MAASSRLGVLMKLDKNQRKPRVFKASDLCPYYNRRVDAAYNSGCFHFLDSPFAYIFACEVIVCNIRGIMYLRIALAFGDFWTGSGDFR